MPRFWLAAIFGGRWAHHDVQQGTHPMTGPDVQPPTPSPAPAATPAAARARRKDPWRAVLTPRGLGFMALVAVIVLAIPVTLHVAPILAARSQFPGLNEARRLAMIHEVATRAVAGFAAYDAAGTEVLVARGTLSAATPGPCQVVHDRWPHPNRPRARTGGLTGGWHVSGRATFTCLFDLQVTGHGPLRAVVRQEFLTNPPQGWPRSDPRARAGAEGRHLLDALERRRAAPSAGRP